MECLVDDNVNVVVSNGLLLCDKCQQLNKNVLLSSPSATHNDIILQTGDSSGTCGFEAARHQVNSQASVECSDCSPGHVCNAASHDQSSSKMRSPCRENASHPSSPGSSFQQKPPNCSPGGAQDSQRGRDQSRQRCSQCDLNLNSLSSETHGESKEPPVNRFELSQLKPFVEHKSASVSPADSLRSNANSPARSHSHKENCKDDPHHRVRPSTPDNHHSSRAAHSPCVENSGQHRYSSSYGHCRRWNQSHDSPDCRHSLGKDKDGDSQMLSKEPLSYLSNLPLEFITELHDFDHHNEDLSAEVVYSLHLRSYEIKEVLGKGISSTVRRVVEKTTGQEFAVKIIDISGEKGEATQVEQTKKDTYREIRILRMCGGHPNIIELHDVFETPTFIFLVFEICKKGELFDYLTSVVSLSEKRTRIFMRQLLEAVEFIHSKNIVHRDLKPENILLDDNLNIKVSDFGFATVIEPGEELVELCGTPGYLAPEVLAHSMYENVSGYGKEVDMWACGVIMYTLLCGAPPFWNRRQMMMLRAIMNADYTFNSPEWDDISDPPKNLIQKLLVVNPQQRLTAKEALNHPFFHSQVDMVAVEKNIVEIFTEEKRFDARRKFRAGVFCVVFYLRLIFSYKHPPPISVETVRNNPYGIKVLRKVIDTCAFGMYKHWVKRVDNQNRAALFEHTLRDDWKHSLMTLDGVIA